MNLPIYECDNCGACCKGHLIVETDELDLLREPRLVDADVHSSKKSVEETLAEMRSLAGRVILIACGSKCHFLNGENKCDIYPTRPNVCVAMEAGDEQCQIARKSEGLEPLQPNQ